MGRGNCSQCSVFGIHCSDWLKGSNAMEMRTSIGWMILALALLP
jgi:hypothetical protein